MTLDLSSLNPAQRAAVETTEGPLLVLAGAGSGKTRVLTYRIAHLVADKRVSPAEILAITFTNKAAGEMRERLAGICGGGVRSMWVLTFHAMCVRMLRYDAERLGFTSNFSIYDDDDSQAPRQGRDARARARRQALSDQRGPQPHLLGEERARGCR